MKSRSLFRKQFENKRFKKALKILDYAMYNTESFLYPNPLLAAACFAIEMPLIGNFYFIIYILYEYIYIYSYLPINLFNLLYQYSYLFK